MGTITLPCISLKFECESRAHKSYLIVAENNKQQKILILQEKEKDIIN